MLFLLPDQQRQITEGNQPIKQSIFAYYGIIVKT